MPLFRYQNAVVLFIHVPKTGGSSIEQALMDMGGRPALFLTESAPDYAACTPQHMPADLLMRFVPEAFYDMRFAVVRNPLDRMISEFRMRRAARQQRGLRALSFEAWVNMAFGRHRKNPYAFDNHIRPQTELIPEETPIFRYEDGLSAVVAAVADFAGIAPAPLPRLRVGAPEPVAVTAEATQRITRFYAADYERFGYDPNMRGG